MSQELTAQPSANDAQEKKAPIWQTFKLKRHPALAEEITAFNFQDYSIYRAITSPAFCLGLATGTGKTFCSYAAYFYYRSKFPNTKLLVITTKSAVIQFAEEREKFFNVPGFKSYAVGAKMKKMYQMTGKKYADCRKQAYEQFSTPMGGFGSADSLVMNYSVFRTDFAELYKHLKKMEAEGTHLFVIYDEAAKFKNMDSQTFKCVERTSALAMRKIAATATLTKGKLEEAYAIMRGIGVSLYPSLDIFMDAHCITFQPPGAPSYAVKIVGYKNTSEFVRRLKDFSVILTKADVAPFLPKFTSTISYVEHSAEQRDLIRSVYSGILDIRRFSAEANGSLPDWDDDNINLDVEVNTDLTKLPSKAKKEEEENPLSGLQKIDRLTEVGFIKRALMDIRNVTNKDLSDVKSLSPKTEMLIDALCDEYTNEKIVLYTPSKRYLKLVAESIRKNKHVPDFYKNVLEIQGEVGEIERNENKKLFSESPDHNIIILNDAGLEALNLQASGTLIVLSLPRSAGDLVQLAGRVSRIGSAQSALSIRYILTEDSQDEDDYAAIQSQLLVMYFAQNCQESEEGLMDWKFLRKMYGLQGKSASVTEEEKDEILSRADRQLLLASRERRASSYI